MPSILIVDDSPGVHETLRTLLRAQGFDTVFYRSASEAFERYKQEPFDVVLTDIWMKPMNGVTLLKKIRREDPYAVVVMMTGFDSKEFVIRSFKNGAFDYLEKPFRFETLIQTLNSAIEERGRRLALKEGGRTGDVFLPTGTGDDFGRLEDEKKELEEARETLQRLERQVKKRELQLKESEQALFRRSDELALQRRNLEAEREEFEERNVKEREALQSIQAELETREELQRKAQRALDDRETDLAKREVALRERIAELENADASFMDQAKAQLDPDTSRLLSELEQRERRLAEAESALVEREQFIEESENTLFEKGQTIQELETELEQLQEDLNKKAARLTLREQEAS